MVGRFLSVVAAAACLSACAKSPESIGASYVADEPYASRSCSQILAEYARTSDMLLAASNQQSSARTNDTIGVLVVGLPIASMGGDDIEPKIARLKGEQDALRRAMTIKRCS